MEIREIIQLLKKPFPPEAHQERKLPGGGRWFFIPWQEIRDRLDEVCPDWQMAWNEPIYLGQNCVITCTITILGISRSAPGNAPIELISSSGKDMSRGTPVERAVADAFKNAAEAWGVARYLDDQKFVVSYMSKSKDMRAYKFATENNQIDVGARGEKRVVATSGQSVKPKPNKAQKATYPENNATIKAIRTITGHDANWILSRCRQYGGTKPEDTKDIWRVIFEMCAEFALKNQQVSSIEGGLKSASDAIAVARSAGTDPLNAALSWLERHQAARLSQPA